MSILKRTRELLAIEPGVYKTLWIFSLTVSLLSLVVPIAAQTLVNFIAFGNLLQPVIVLCVIVLMVMLASACLRIYQIRLVEWLQRRVFVQVGLKVADLLPRLKLLAVSKHKGSELVNHFFDVVIIQKSIASLIISGLETILKTLFSMILLASYHPWLMLFDICLISTLVLVIYLPFKAALRTAVDECMAKHKVAAWFEEIVQVPLYFKMQRHPKDALQKTDHKLSQYLLSRDKHFNLVISQICMIYVIAIVSSVILLGLGAYLVIRGQLTLGQLVASEIVLTAMVASFIKLGNYLDDIYDGLASANKVYELLHLPLEMKADIEPNELEAIEVELNKPLTIEAEDLCYELNTNETCLRNINFTLHEGMSLAIINETCAGSEPLIDVLIGLRQPLSGLIKYNKLILEERFISLIRRHIAIIRQSDLISGDLIDNLILNHESRDINHVQTMLSLFNLNQGLALLSNGLNTPIQEVIQVFTELELKKICIARALLGKPRLLIIDGAFDLFDEDLIISLRDKIKMVDRRLTIMIVTRSQKIAQYFDKQLLT